MISTIKGKVEFRVLILLGEHGDFHIMCFYVSKGVPNELKAKIRQKLGSLSSTTSRKSNIIYLTIQPCCRTLKY